MSIWLVLWAVISLILLGFLGWSLLILYRQKKTWKAFAEKHKLRFKSNALMEGPEMDGTIESYKFSFFTGEHLTPDVRSTRKLTAVEVSLHSTMPIDGGIASGGMIPFIEALRFKAEVRPEHKSWSKAYLAAGDNRFVLGAYMTDERIEAITKLMKIKNAWVVLIFRGERMLLRIDMADPIAAPDYLEKLTVLLLKVTKILEVSESEYKALKAEEARGAMKDSAPVLEEKHVEEAAGLQLEEDSES
ncbi:MAG: hypothetical protein H6861_06905 [Rhodospirillales bacterium]|nr:hypothetical protein [Rhodospirillales bacterium]